MLNKTLYTCLVPALLVLAIGASACSGIPTVGPVQPSTATSTAAPTEIPTAAPTDTPTAAPTSAATPQAKGTAPRAVPPAQALQNALKQAGLTGGVVAANDGTKLTFGTGKAARQLVVAPDALIIIPGKNNAQVADVAIGDRVITRVIKVGGTATARFLLDFPKDYTARNVLVGVVQSSMDESATLRTKGGPRDIATSSSTTVIGAQGPKPGVASLDDLKRGDAVLVIGQDSGGSFTAQVIVVVRRNVANPGAGKPGLTPTPTQAP